MRVLEPTLAKKREVTSGTKEWADHNVNCIKGCLNDCRYCYAKLIARRFGRSTDQTWKEMEIRDDVLNKTFRQRDGRVMFPSSHDIVDTPEAKEACFAVLKKLLEAGNEVLVTTKPRLSIIRDIGELFYRFESQMQFRFTITSIDNHLLSFWEPNAPSFEERLASLRYAYQIGLKTSVSIEPFLDYNPKTLIEIVSPYVTESIWLGPMNYIPRNGIATKDKKHYKEIRRNYELQHLREVYDDLLNCPKIRFKDSMTNRLGL